MSENGITRIAIIGTGTIGASWAAYYLARGLDVVATDPAPGAEANLRRFVDQAWPAPVAQGLSPGASIDRRKFTPDLKRAVSEAQLIQENAPGRGRAHPAPDAVSEHISHREAVPGRSGRGGLRSS